MCIRDSVCEPAAAQGLDNMLTLSLFDAQGWRGARHRGGNRHDVWIEANAATPGYLPGPLPPGAWIVQIDAHRTLPGAPFHYTPDIEIRTEISSGAPGGVTPDIGQAASGQEMCIRDSVAAATAERGSAAAVRQLWHARDKILLARVLTAWLARVRVVGPDDLQPAHMVCFLYTSRCV